MTTLRRVITACTWRCGLALAADEPSTVDGAWSTVISYPGFHTDLGSL